MVAYTTYQSVEALLGVTLTSGQRSLVTDVLEPSMRAYIDRYTGRSWGVTSPVTSEQHTVYGGTVYLKNKPVAAITLATVRWPGIGGTSTTLVDDSTYELINAATGEFRVSAADGSLLSVSYTHTDTLPADIGLAASWLVAAQMSDVLVSDPALIGVKKYSAGQGDISIEFDTQAAASQAQKGIDLLKLRRAFVFA